MTIDDDIGDALLREVERLRAENAALRQKISEGIDGWGAAVRNVLETCDVPAAAFIDDHVANAIVQRDQARAELARQRRLTQYALSQLAGVRDRIQGTMDDIEGCEP